MPFVAVHRWSNRLFDSTANNSSRATSHPARNTVSICSKSIFFMRRSPLNRIARDLTRGVFPAKFVQRKRCESTCRGGTGDKNRHCCNTCGTHLSFSPSCAGFCFASSIRRASPIPSGQHPPVFFDCSTALDLSPSIAPSHGLSPTSFCPRACARAPRHAPLQQPL